MSIRHAAAEAWSVARSGPGRSILAAALIGVSLYLPGLLFLLVRNVSRLVSPADDRFSLVATVSVGGDPRALAETLARRSDIRQVRIVRAAAARARFERTFPDLRGALTNLTDVAFPSSIEIEPDSAATVAERASIAAAARALPGIEQVEDDSAIADRFRDFLLLARRGAMALGLILVVAAILSVSSAVRLALDRHRDEVEIMRLMGATEGSIRAPFWLYGTFAGAAGGLVSFLLLAGTFGVASVWLHRLPHPFLSVFWVRFLEPLAWPAFPVAGALAGFLGAAASIRAERAG